MLQLAPNEGPGCSQTKARCPFVLLQSVCTEWLFITWRAIRAFTKWPISRHFQSMPQMKMSSAVRRDCRTKTWSEKCSKKERSKSHLSSEMFASSQLWQENLQRQPEAVFHYEWVSPRAAVLIDTGPSSFDVWGVVVAERERRAPHYHAPFPPSPHLGGCRESLSATWGEQQRLKHGQRGGQKTSPNQTPLVFFGRLGEIPKNLHPDELIHN